MCFENILIITGNIYKKFNSQPRLVCLYFNTLIKQISNAIKAFLNKQLINFKNFFGVLSRLCHGKGAGIA